MFESQAGLLLEAGCPLGGSADPAMSENLRTPQKKDGVPLAALWTNKKQSKTDFCLVGESQLVGSIA